MLRHVALFELRTGTPDTSVDAMRNALLALVDVVPSLRAISVGVDLGLRDDNHDVALIADFDGVDGYDAYRSHPEHLAVVERYVTPLVVRRAAVQYEIGPQQVP